MENRVITAERREWNRTYQNRWYHANKAVARETRRKTREKLNVRVRDYKVARGCERCPERHPNCLEFHHADPAIKEEEPADMIRRGWSFERLSRELDKLLVLCANCHRKEHARLQEIGKRPQSDER